MPVRKADLGSLTKISEGGYGAVYRVPSSFRLPTAPATPLAYKEFTRDEAVQAEAARRSVLFRDLLPAGDRADLDRCAVWPLTLVEDKGAVSGLLMPLIPPEFFFELNDAQSGQKTAQLRDLKWLNATGKQLAANGLSAEADFTERLALLAQLVYCVARLHKQNWLFGDISFSNAAYAINPPRMILLDCDGASSVAEAALRPAVSTFGWEPPECAQLNFASKATDVYKLGLAILRCLSPDGANATIKEPKWLAGQLDAAGVALIARALDHQPAPRPQAKELYHYLKAALDARIAPPRVLTATLLTPIRPRGSDVRVQFAVENVTEITITVGTAAVMTVPVSVPGQPQVEAFPGQASGRVVLEAKNRFDSVRVDLGELEMFEVPQFDVAGLIGALPRVAVPTLDSFNSDVLAPALKAVPRIDVPRVPRLPAMATGDLPRKLRDVVLPDADLAGALRLPRIANIARLPDFGALAGVPLRVIAESLVDAAAVTAEARRPGFLKAAVDNAKDGDS